MTALTMVLLLLINAADALRDRWVDRRSGIGWLRWHLVKWFSYFGLSVGWCVGFGYSLIQTAVLAVGCWVVWNVVYWYGRLQFELSLSRSPLSGECVVHAVCRYSEDS